MLSLSALLNFFDNPIVGVTAKALSIPLLVLVVFLSIRLAGADTRLAQARRQTISVAAERDRALAELAQTRDVVGRLERGLSERGEHLPINLDDADMERRTFDLTQAHADAREARLMALRTVDPRSVESRWETARRVIRDALKEQGA